MAIVLSPEDLAIEDLLGGLLAADDAPRMIAGELEGSGIKATRGLIAERQREANRLHKVLEDGDQAVLPWRPTSSGLRADDARRAV